MARENRGEALERRSITTRVRSESCPRAALTGSEGLRLTSLSWIQAVSSQRTVDSSQSYFAILFAILNSMALLPARRATRRNVAT